MKHTITIIIFLISITISAQHKSLGISFNSGVSKITNTFLQKINKNSENNIGISGNIGVYYNYYFNTKSLIEIDLLYTLLSSNQVDNITIINNDNSTIEHERIKYQSRNYYITIPIKYGLEHNEFIYTLGAQASININNFLESEGASINKPKNFKETREYDRYKKIDFGINVGIEKILDSGIILGLNYYHGLNDFADNNGGSSIKNSIKNRQLTFGIKYEFYRKLL